MLVKQLPVFVKNHEGRLEQVTEVLKEENTNILSLSMADTTEYGMLRMTVSSPEKIKNGLREKGLSIMLTDILAVKLEDHVGEPYKMTHTPRGQGLNTEHMYALISANRRVMIVEASDGETATKAIIDDRLALRSDEEMCR